MSTYNAPTTVKELEDLLANDTKVQVRNRDFRP